MCGLNCFPCHMFPHKTYWKYILLGGGGGGDFEDGNILLSLF